MRSHRRNYGYVHVPKKRTPHLLGFGSEWRKCFVVHPHTQTSQPLESYLRLTGSVVQEGLPSTLPRVEREREETVLLEERLRAAEIQQRQTEGLKGKRGADRVCHILSSGLVGLWMSGEQHLQSSTLTCCPRVESYWRCDGRNFLSVTHPLFILHTTQPLGLFSDPDYYNSTLPSTSQQPQNLGLFEHSFDQITPFAGCHHLSPTASTHTVFCSDLKARSHDQLLTHGLIQLFSLAAAEWVQNGHPFTSDLAYPRALQGILSNGHQLMFLAFQLNTLYLNQERGRRNVLWVGPILDLLSEDGVNRECSELLAAFITHCPDRDKDSRVSSAAMSLQ